MNVLALASLSLALAACSAPPGTGNVIADATPGDAAIAATEPSSRPTPTATTFPVAFRGRWGMTANDCDPDRDDTKGLMVVSPGAIAFYESRATVAALTTASPTRITADLSFSGEGQTWRSRTMFELADGGTRLTRAEETPSSSFAYRKCAA